MTFDERSSSSSRSTPSLWPLLSTLALLTTLVGCAGRENVTKSERSAIEQALLTQAAEDVFNEMLRSTPPAAPSSSSMAATA
jgi:hypothetical protein